MPAQAVPSEVAQAKIAAGLAAAVAQHGYAGATLNDIVREAAISKSTFYAHFRDKEDAFLWAYDAASETTLDVIRKAVAGATGSAEHRLLAGTRAYLSLIAANPEMTRTFIVEVLAAGPRARAARLAVNARFAEVQRALVDDARFGDASIGPLSPVAAQILVGGVNELVLTAVVEDRLNALPAMADEVAAMFRAAVSVR